MSQLRLDGIGPPALTANLTFVEMVVRTRDRDQEHFGG